jgi:hypothetical protein
MPRKQGSSYATDNGTQAAPESLAMRPSTGLSFQEMDQVNRMVRATMRLRLEQLPPSGKLTEDQKAEVYAEVAARLSLDLDRPVTAQQVTLTATNLRTQKASPDRRRTIGLLPLHHTLIEAEAYANEVSRTAVLRSILDTHYELSPLDR